MDLTTGTILIYSGEGDEGTWERYEGARTVKAIRNRLTRERAHGDRWASAWIEEPTLEDAGYPGVPVYCEINRDFNGVWRMRAVPADQIRINPAAKVSDIVRETFKPERTLTQRVAMVERKQAELERRVAALERKK